MKNSVYIIGASGFGREVAWLISELDNFSIVGFIDDNKEIQGTVINGLPVLGGLDYLININEEINVVIAIGKPKIRQLIVNKLKTKRNVNYPNILSKDVRISKYIKLGFGNIICANSILTTNISIGNYNIINLSCTVGHDVVINDYITIYPSVNISGNVIVGNICEIGTGTQIIQEKIISSNVIVGAGSVVINNINESGTYVGVPAKKIK